MFEGFGKFKFVLFFCLNQNNLSHCLSIVYREIEINVDFYSGTFSAFNVTAGRRRHQ